MFNPLVYNDSDMLSYVARPVTPDDLEAVRRVDCDAFETYRRKQHQIQRALSLRTVENMSAAIRRAVPGVVIECPPGKVVGYCFTHVWGLVGWLGTLGVSPRSQGLGLGRSVIAAGLDTLRRAGCRTLALETMPESGKNIALYNRLGLEARRLTLLCQGTVNPAASMQFERWRGDNALRVVASQLVDGLDPTPAAQWLAAEEAGQTFVWRDGGQPVAFAILRTKPRRLESLQLYITVEAAACLPCAAGEWPRYVAEMQAYAQMLGKTGLLLPVNARQHSLLRAALEARFKIVHTRVRMVDGEALGAPDAILMLTLAM
ncbi:MAG: GNAT family N-acetyltransferase [Anaerolineae bacterium]|nr:GNAT family N-acetyltransferase [Anaerolineae bacterium]